MNQKYNIPDFAKYLNIDSPKDEDILMVLYDDKSKVPLKSEPIKIDFYLLAIKLDFDESINYGQTNFDKTDSLLYFDAPNNNIEWDLEKPMTGYNILISSNFFDKYAKRYSFMHYNNHEALFVRDEEKKILLDLFEKAYSEYNKTQFSKEIITSYANLILTYIEKYYKRQFDTRSSLYNKVVADFHKNLDAYFNDATEIKKLPTVSYFANKSNLSSNYFGDLIKHFTGKSAQNYIQQYILQIAKSKLKQTTLSISEIAYSLGFGYPTYFTRFFKKEVGVTPTIFRNQ
ncbi:helix-turn-helix domain-containing protein [Tenacibaculum sp. Mcav3-52]|uniref:AraC family transcriptional regulator n=1 Tax=Tenacibaculum mesophilum TaxID=104268 RepID=A0AAE9MQ95_9FLAO|nr:MULTISPECIES: helix-turn-helix domain-containing protein [Tenacibaculum]GFD92064.1 AraC family transcriptional regulator [Alteromonas sp. KUL154]GFE01657.1 AraC family transcriptional regulator [Alteromonas sp. KUL156]MCG7501859.1 helix-turn-helix domain-containing protein [Tenacibaculum sp. Mcav3-52]UTD16324.1 AraC family transcriptional regulator [Tenacibaculum mesophilum]BFF35427.1 helix-turn-helix domain-containing protein [Tenacibaculum mesophilum]